jgi:hypothetical protein
VDNVARKSLLVAVIAIGAAVLGYATAFYLGADAMTRFLSGLFAGLAGLGLAGVRVGIQWPWRSGASQSTFAFVAFALATLAITVLSASAFPGWDAVAVLAVWPAFVISEAVIETVGARSAAKPAE